MFENDVPKHKIGMLQPLALIDNTPYEFYRLAPPRVMLVMIPIGLSEILQGRRRAACVRARSIPISTS